MCRRVTIVDKCEVFAKHKSTLYDFSYMDFMGIFHTHMLIDILFCARDVIVDLLNSLLRFFPIFFFTVFQIVFIFSKASQ